MTGSEELQDGAPQTDTPETASRKLTPTDQSLLNKLLCRIFGHSWNGHRFVEGPDTRPAITCQICEETRVYDERVPEDCEVTTENV